MTQIEKLQCAVKNYSWGKKGSESLCARLFAAGHPNAEVDESAPYAELWCGTHPDGPATICSTNELLSRTIAKHLQQKCSAYSDKKTNLHLPFIMKIMSIDHTLSLQVHPNKQQAYELNMNLPDHYPDRNHKPELAYALTKFELLCGFRTSREIVQNMDAFPELALAMGQKRCENFKKLAEIDDQSSDRLKMLLKQCFKAMLQFAKDNPPDTIAKLLYSFQHRLLTKNVRGCLSNETVQVIKKIYNRFKNDIGVFAPLIMNHIILEPGECCFYETGELHAYLSGECVECVGCSNNTIRAGLTPKYVDVENLIRVVNCRMTSPYFYVVPPCPVPNYPYIVEYAPSCKDFALHKIEIEENATNKSTDYHLPAIDCQSILIFTEGHATCFDYGLDFDGNQNNAEEINANIHQLIKLKSFIKQENIFTAQRGDIFYIPPMRILRILPNYGHPFRICAFRTFSFEPLVSDDLLTKKIQFNPKVFTLSEEINNNVHESKMKNNHSNNRFSCSNLPLHLNEIFDISLEMDGFL